MSTPTTIDQNGDISAGWAILEVAPPSKTMSELKTLVEPPFWAVSEVQTAIKTAPIQTSDLKADQVIWLEPHSKFFIHEFQRAEGGHWKVKIDGAGYDINQDYFIYDDEATSHWLLSWEQDDKEQEIIQAPDVVSRVDLDEAVGQDLTPDMAFSTRITPHITYGEFALYQEARRFNFNYQCQTAYEIAVFLEQVRSAFGDRPIKITSGHRPPAVNAAVGGARHSEHLFDFPMVGAVDFLVSGVSIREVQAYCDENWNASIGYGAPRGFVHLGARRSLTRHIRWFY